MKNDEDSTQKAGKTSNFDVFNKLLPQHVNLIAVSKKQPQAKIDHALDCGHRMFGENYVQEAYVHWSDKREQFPDLTLHLIGPLQTNKADEAVLLFDYIHTLDRPKLAEALAVSMAKHTKQVQCFIQVNTGEEDQKSGVLPSELKLFYARCMALKLPVIGLMCIPPMHEPAGLHFALLRTLADGLGLNQLSMGMSDDWQQAVKAGATHIRIGTALFGARA